MTDKSKDSIGIKIEPTDVFLFRDGSPFNQADEGASVATSLFPPPLPTIIGAIRFSVATKLGFPQTPWPKSILGDGVNWQDPETKLGTLCFDSTRLLVERNDKAELLYPAPLHLALASKDDNEDKHQNSDAEPSKENVLLMPECEVQCDLSVNGEKVVFPTAPRGFVGVKTRQGAYITKTAMEDILNGRTPKKEDIWEPDQVFTQETRVGIGIEESTRTVKDGQLYSATFLRLADGISFLQPVSGIPSNFETATVRFGGEHRTAYLTKHTLDPLPKRTSEFSVDDDALYYKAVCLSPVVLDEEPKPNMPVKGLRGELVSLATNRPLKLGGWDSEACIPLPMMPIMPVGTVFFMRAKGTDKEAVMELHTAKIGHSTKWGFGDALLGLFSYVPHISSN